MSGSSGTREPRETVKISRLKLGRKRLSRAGGRPTPVSQTIY